MVLDEFGIIQHYFSRQATQPSVIKGIGDDCAILSVPEQQQLVLSLDTLVEGRHFPASAAPYDIATRAMCTAISDLAAMGATPLWFTLALTLPDVNEAWLEAFSRGIFDIADSHTMDLIGGDTTCGPLTISVQVHGCVDPGQLLTRGAACIGDHLFVSGNLGDGAAALAAIQGRITPSSEVLKHLHSRFYAPSPQIVLGRQLLPFSSAAIDISDGLLADAQHIADASGVGMRINIDQLPIDSALTHYSDDYYSWALSGGDDYQLLFTVSDDKIESFKRYSIQHALDVSAIGHVVDASHGVSCYDQGLPYSLPANQRGYQHFTA
ncbi:thiamine-phosphate kinase [Eionea flava]